MVKHSRETEARNAEAYAAFYGQIRFDIKDRISEGIGVYQGHGIKLMHEQIGQFKIVQTCVPTEDLAKFSIWFLGGEPMEIITYCFSKGGVPQRPAHV